MTIVLLGHFTMLCHFYVYKFIVLDFSSRTQQVNHDGTDVLSAQLHETQRLLAGS